MSMGKSSKPSKSTQTPGAGKSGGGGSTTGGMPTNQPLTGKKMPATGKGKVKGKVGSTAYLPVGTTGTDPAP